jgi:hypothetical protein
MLVQDVKNDRTYAFTRTRFFEVREQIAVQSGVHVDWDDQGRDAQIKQIVDGLRSIDR